MAFLLSQILCTSIELNSNKTIWYLNNSIAFKCLLALVSFFFFLLRDFIAFWYDNVLKWRYAVLIYFWFGSFLGFLCVPHETNPKKKPWREEKMFVWIRKKPNKVWISAFITVEYLQRNAIVCGFWFKTDIFCQSIARPHINSWSSHDKQWRMINLLVSIK